MEINKNLILSLDKIVTPSGCWQLLSYNKNYPSITINKQVYRLNRLVCHLWHGLDLSDLDRVACHSCNNKACFNPIHIYDGSYSDNLIDAVNAKVHGQVKRTHCKLGHLLDGVKYRKSGKRERYCKACQRIANNKLRRKV